MTRTRTKKKGLRVRARLKKKKKEKKRRSILKLSITRLIDYFTVGKFTFIMSTEKNILLRLGRRLTLKSYIHSLKEKLHSYSVLYWCHAGQMTAMFLSNKPKCKIMIFETEPLRHRVENVAAIS